MPRPARRPSRPGRPTSRGARAASAKAKVQARDKAKPAPRGRSGWKNGLLPVLGLVGGIGAGKTAVAAAMAEQGARVLDADAIGHALLDQTPAREEVVARFGEGVLVEGDPARVDRKRLGEIVFADPRALRDLEAILHPRMRRTFEKAIARAARRRTHRLIVLDAAILFEAGWDDLCDRVAFVEAPREVRLARLADARGWTAEQVEARERAQLSLEQKRARADFAIENSGDEGRLAADLAAAWGRLHVRPRSRPSLAPPGAEVPPAPESAPGPEPDEGNPAPS
jgi:dephospho-CoA kinase